MRLRSPALPRLERREANPQPLCERRLRQSSMEPGRGQLARQLRPASSPRRAGRLPWSHAGGSVEPGTDASTTRTRERPGDRRDGHPWTLRRARIDRWRGATGGPSAGRSGSSSATHSTSGAGSRRSTRSTYPYPVRIPHGRSRRLFLGIGAARPSLPECARSLRTSPRLHQEPVRAGPRPCRVPDGLLGGKCVRCSCVPLTSARAGGLRRIPDLRGVPAAGRRRSRGRLTCATEEVRKVPASLCPVEAW